MKQYSQMAKVALLTLLFLFPAYSSQCQSVGSGEGELDPSFVAKPIVQLSWRPILSQARINRNLPHGQDTSSRDSSSQYYLTCPYQLGLSLALQLSSGLNSVKNIREVYFDLVLSQYSETFIPPVMQSPGIGAFRRVITNQDQSTLNKRLMFFEEGLYLFSRKDSIQFDSMGKYISVPEFFAKQEFVLPSVKGSRQVAKLTLKGKRTGQEIQGDTLYFIRPGVVIMLEEVIDPENKLEFSLTNIKILLEGKSDTLRPVITGNMGTFPARYAADLSQETRKLTTVVTSLDPPGACLRNADAKVAPADWSMAYYKCNSKGACLENRYFRLVDMEEAKRKHEKYLVWHCVGSWMKFDLVDAVGGISPDSVLGIASDSTHNGYCPLWVGHRRKGANPNLPPERYSTCMEMILHDPNYTLMGILCYVIVPNDGETPCAP